MASALATSRQPVDQIEPVPALLKRVREELSAAFLPGRPIRVSRAPGRLDVMGGIADYTGSLICESTLNCATAVALQERDDRQVQVFSFNLLDENRPFTLNISLDALATSTADELRREFNEPGRRWAGYVVGCLYLMHEQALIDLRDPQLKGINLAVYSTVPLGAGVSSSAALEVATMTNLRDHFGLADPLDPMWLATLCQAVENRIVGAPCGVMDQVVCCAGQPHTLLQLLCQPHELQDPIFLRHDVRLLGIYSGVRHSLSDGQYARTRCAAFMGHRILLEKMRQIGRVANRALERDPMHGYLANLDPEDYQKLFRPHLPQTMKGGEFLLRYGGTIDKATTVEPGTLYPIRSATDHHVFEARRVKKFIHLLEEAASAVGSADELLRSAGRLMYESHVSYTQDAMLGCDACDTLVALVREREAIGFYGAKITAGGNGGTVAVLAAAGAPVEAAVTEILSIYQQRTGLMPLVFPGSSPGAWHVGTAVV